ncbi:MAG: hypothetical protein R3F19_29990 [Verrucomicrobiales bacterium]
MRVHVIILYADEPNPWCRCSVPAGSVEEFWEVILGRLVRIEDEWAFGVEFR